ncbi:hypothetical protein BHK98_07890 [Hornefia porci]|uniref:Transcription regulator PadR N-terminal domain-containing protein n=1 Tax=Hornefia porci TaxID=2652292 RepID=A0A1Q9JIF0_9FIRM|nr:PadR family transcriptional regulator [Hornefia porci]OLR55986.1 hypothetical protein BHK98_07890 [Hornefia porci]
MARGRSSFKMGTVEMLVLYLLEKKDLYGYQLTNLIREISEGDVDMQESTLYPTVYKLREKGYLSEREVIVGKRRLRVYYHLEDSGRERLADLLEDYRQITRGIRRILECDTLPEEQEK